MADPDAYIALVSSLPSSERLFVAKQPPLSRIRLERRLKSLSEHDLDTLRRIENLLSWNAYSMTDGAEQSIQRTKDALATLDSSTLRDVVAERLDLRAVIAALRMRDRNDAPPTAPWAYSRLVPHIIANWGDEHFRLADPLPWLREAVALLKKNEPDALERHILEVTFRQLQRHASRHHFDFEAVVIYVLKWNIFDRWARADARAAAVRFEALAQEALGDFSDLRLEGAAQ